MEPCLMPIFTIASCFVVCLDLNFLMEAKAKGLKQSSRLKRRQDSYRVLGHTHLNECLSQ